MAESKAVFQLQDVVSFDTLRDIMFELGTITGLRVSLANYKGEVYEELENPHTLNSCTCIRKSCIGHYCEKSNAYAGLEAARMGEPFIYRCHMGAAETASPIIVNGQYLGSLLAGQAKLPDQEMAQLEQIIKPVENVSSLPPDVQEAYREHKNLLRPYTMEKLKAMSRLLFNMANYIAEISCNNIMRKQLGEYEMALLQAKNLNAELEGNLATMQLKNMQTQMNPHFLFNALNTISQQSLLEGAEKTSGLIVSLSDILRKTIKTSNQVTTLGDEFSYIKNYLHIMSVSLQDRLHVVYDAEDSCLDAQLPILTIQPLVENAVLHGIDRKAGGGTVTISMYRAAGRVNIIVADTGEGMAPETLARIRALRNPTAAPEKDTSLGIKNVIRILTEFFKPDFRWSVESSAEKGTRFTVRIPYRPLIIDNDSESRDES